MKKYLIVSEGSEPTVSSNCMNRAKAYAEEMLRTEPEGTPVHIYIHQLRACRSAIAWTSVLPKTKAKKAKTPKTVPKAPKALARAVIRTRKTLEGIPFGKHRWTEEDRSQLITLKKAGHDNAAIATLLGRSEKAISMQFYRISKT